MILGQTEAANPRCLLAAGIREPDAGQITIDGSPLQHGNPAARSRLGYVPDSSDPLPELLVTEFHVACGQAQAGEATIPALSETLGVQPYLAQRLSSLSFGQRKRACLWRRSLAILCCSCWTSRATVLIPVASRWWWILSDRGVSRGWRRLWRPMTRHFAQALSARCLRIANGQLTSLDDRRQRGSVRRAKTVGWAAPFIEKWVALPSDKIAT